jgi:hypothetical protein
MLAINSPRAALWCLLVFLLLLGFLFAALSL